MTEVFAAFALGASSTGLAFFFADRLAKRERTALLDRLMARDLGEFKAYEPKTQTPAPKPSREERERAAEDARVADLAGGLV